MMRRILAALYAELSERPVMALTLGFLGTSFVYGYVTESIRLRRMLRETTDSLNARAEEIEAKLPRMYDSENRADYSPDRWQDGGEIAARLG